MQEILRGRHRQPLIAPDVKGNAHWDGEKIRHLRRRRRSERPIYSCTRRSHSRYRSRRAGHNNYITAYLGKKEKLIRQKHLVSAAGEEELVAYYMTHMNSAGEHDFTKPDGTNFIENESVSFDVGFYSNMLNNEQYRAKKAADQVSYVWDGLIEAFTTHMLAGTTIVPDGKVFQLAEHEQGVRHMALVSRYQRRNFGGAILGALEKGKTTDRFTEQCCPVRPKKIVIPPSFL